jgi:hypothetical protein
LAAAAGAVVGGAAAGGVVGAAAGGLVGAAAGCVALGLLQAASSISALSAANRRERENMADKHPFSNLKIGT